MGVLDIETHNQALLIKFLHKFLNKANIPWVNIIWETYYQESLHGERMVGSFWWKAHLKLIPLYKEFAKCNIGKGDSVFFGMINGLMFLSLLNFQSFTPLPKMTPS